MLGNFGENYVPMLAVCIGMAAIIILGLILFNLFFIDRIKRTKKELNASEKQLRTLINAMPDLVVFKDQEGRWLEANDFARRFFGLERVPFNGKKDFELADLSRFYHDAFLVCEKSDKQVWEKGKTIRVEEVFSRLNDTTYIFDMIKVPVYHLDGNPKGLLIIGRDITERKQIEEALRKANEQFNLAARAVHCAIYDWDIESNTIEWTYGLTELFGYPLEEVKPTPEWWFEHLHPEDRLRLQDEVLLGQDFDGEYRFLHRNGSYLHVWDRGFVVRNSEGRATRMIGSMVDITERKQAEKAIRHMAYHDALTDLPNRTLFYDRLMQELEKAKQNQSTIAVMFLDLDCFKGVNDALGHATGDRLLQEVAKTLNRYLDKDCLMARMGGDEFTILLPNMNQVEDAERLALTIRKCFEQPMILDGNEFNITASVGIAVYPNDGEEAEVLMKNADAAMYAAKRQGRNNYQFYSRNMNDKAFERLKMEKDLRKALNQGELLLHYQPRIHTQTGNIVGMEALLRWQHPESGMVSPAEFIPLAEETGLIVPIGEWVLRTVCQQNKKWQDRGLPPLRVAVNLSACQFRQKNLVETVVQILQETGMEGRWLELEITESMIMQNEQATIKTLQELKAMGVTISIDDFGTGYSSLGYLQYFPVDNLKIDQSFVRNLESDHDKEAVVTAIIQLAHSLRMKVVAEGVENETQFNYLRGQKCDEMQGYFFSRPVPKEEFELIVGWQEGMDQIAK